MERIRNYQRADAGSLVEAYNELHPTRPQNANAFHQQLEEAVGDDGRIWTVERDGRPVAYGLISPIPGLDGMVHLQGLVAPKHQRQGVGGRLLQHLCDEAGKRGFQRLSSPVEALDSPAGCFLRQHGFTLEHEEIALRRSLAKELPKMTAVSSGKIVTLPRRKVIPRFCTLYERAFAGLPWAQPYTEAEVAWILQAAEDLLFLHIDKQLAGFAWLQFNSPQMDEQLLEERVGVIEPLGVLPAYQGRGYGRFLLDVALRGLQGRGAQQAQISTWTANEAALSLYKGLGFEFHHSVYYLAREVRQFPQSLYR